MATKRSKTAKPNNATRPQVVLVLQGGGALGAYQVGVMQALQEAGIEPDWVIGTSIGAINAALIAGNDPAVRMERLHAFWDSLRWRSPLTGFPFEPGALNPLANLSVVSQGVPGFFVPNPAALWGSMARLGAERAAYYDTAPLADTLRAHVDFERVNRCDMRLTVGAVNVTRGSMRYFDSREEPLGVAHVMASGALPPAFPAVRIDGELYWDGGILSNTPTEAIFEDNPRRNSLIFAVHVWNPNGPEPTTMAEVTHRQKDIQYSSRVASHIARQQHQHRMRHVIKELAGYIPVEVRNSDVVRDLIDYGCLTRMHVVRLLAPDLGAEDQTKDVDFSPSGVRMRWDAGYADTRKAVEQAPWQGTFDPLEGVVLHEPDANGWYKRAAAPVPEAEPTVSKFDRKAS